MALTPGVAKDFGRTIRFLRHGRERTLADVAVRSGVSIGYLQNIESGVRRSVVTDAYLRIAKGLDLEEAIMRDLIMRAQVLSALEYRGYERDTLDFVWTGVASRLVERGITVRTNLESVIAAMLDGSTPEALA